MDREKQFCIYCLEDQQVDFIADVMIKDGQSGKKYRCQKCSHVVFSLN